MIFLKAVLGLTALSSVQSRYYLKWSNQKYRVKCRHERFMNQFELTHGHDRFLGHGPATEKI
jgi:hypothetical protein